MVLCKKIDYVERLLHALLGKLLFEPSIRHFWALNLCFEPSKNVAGSKKNISLFWALNKKCARLTIVLSPILKRIWRCCMQIRNHQSNRCTYIMYWHWYAYSYIVPSMKNKDYLSSLWLQEYSTLSWKDFDDFAKYLFAGRLVTLPMSCTCRSN
jgi:hypothetical protein